MRGSINWQVQQVFQCVKAIGVSKHQAKVQIREKVVAEGRSPSWHELGRQMGIHSFATADAYRDVWRNLLSFCKSSCDLKDIEQLTGPRVADFLISKVDSGVSHATFMQYAAAIEKLEAALNVYAQRNGTGLSYSFSQDLVRIRKIAHKKLKKFQGSRAYQKVDELIEAIGDPTHRLAACLQLQGGARIHEVNLIRPEQLLGITNDTVSQQLKGSFAICGKGGKNNIVLVEIAIYEKLAQIIIEKGSFEFDKSAYRKSLKRAAENIGTVYKGSHGLRWTYAQNRFIELQKLGFTYEQALTSVSKSMSHERADITEHYLK